MIRGRHHERVTGDQASQVEEEEAEFESAFEDPNDI